jgi:hypothetical protein
MEIKKMKEILGNFVVLLVLTTSISGQKLGITNLKQKLATLEIEVVFKNDDSKDVLIVSPNQKISVETVYFIIPENKTKTLLIRRHFFDYPSTVLDAITPCFGLRRVKAGEIFSEKISLEFPMTKSHYLINDSIDIRDFNFFSFQIGILPYDNFINQIPLSRPFGNCAKGEDMVSSGIYKNKTLIQIQNILKTKEVKLN